MQRKIRRQIERRLRQKAKKALWTSVAAAGLLFGAYGYSLANPAGGTVTSGSATISGEGTTTVTVTQTTDKTTINWNSFSIGSGETVTFNQLSSSSIALNRVTGTDASAIYGTLSSNGKVYLINPNGILFSATAQVNVGGIVAATLDISDSDFLSGNYTFNGSSGSVVNNGTIIASDGGYVVLLGNAVGNSGTITAGSGTVALGAGSQITLDFEGDGLLGLTVDSAALGAFAANSGTITVDGGAVYLSAAAVDTLAGMVVNNSGLIQAQSVGEVNGTIILNGGTNGTVTNSGTLDASGTGSGETGGIMKVLGETVNLADGTLVDVSGAAGGGTALIGGNYQGSGAGQHAITTTVAAAATINADAITTGDGGTVVVWSDGKMNFAGTITARGGSASGDGGSVETSGKTLDVSGTVDAGAAHGKGGNWLLDPNDYTIDATTAASIATSLNSGTNVTVSSDDGISGTLGDLTVASEIGWSGNSVLTLSAVNNIYVNADITAGGNTAGLVMTYGSGCGYTLADGIDITLSGASAGLTIDGNAYTVINNNNKDSIFSSLEGSTDSSLLAGYYALGEDLDLTGVDWTPIGSDSNSFTGVCDGLGNTVSNLTISGSSNYTGLFGYSTGTLRNLGLIDFTVGGNKYVGALVGYNGPGGVIDNCYVTVTVGSAATVFGSGNVGGLAGYNKSGTITNCHSDIAVSVTGDSIGGLVGNNRGSISDSYSTGAIDGANNVGGLAGYMGDSGSSISNCYATGTVTGSGDYVGGLVGRITDSSMISGSYSTGNVTGDDYVGGLVGYIYSGSTVADCHSSGTVNGDGDIGGLAGDNYGAISASYSEGAVTATGTTAGGLVGCNKGTISDSHSTGDVTGSKNNVGGLVGYMGKSTGTITNCYATGDVSGVSYAGGLVGRSQSNSSGSISGSHSTGSVTGTNYVGGLIGANEKSPVTDCYSTSSVSGSDSAVGGLVGFNTGTISSSYSTGTVTETGTDKNSIGGLIGYNTGAVTDCYSTGDVTGSSTYTGGLIGYNTGAIAGCEYSTGTVTGTTDTGGLIGYNYGGAVTDSSSSGTVTCSSEATDVYYAGGLIGYNYGGTVTSCSSSSTVDVTAKVVGGLIGRNIENGTVTDCFATGNVTSTSSYVGGLVGENYGAISDCTYSTGTVSGRQYVGGVAGASNGSITNSSNSGTVTASSYSVGGIAGASGGSIIGCSNSGAISSEYKIVGGIVGDNTGSVSECFNTGTLSGQDYIGGIAGVNEYIGSVSECFNTGTLSGRNCIGGIVGSNSILNGIAGKIANCYNTGTVSGRNYIGGIAGESSGSISVSYNVGVVTGSSYLGGIAGANSGAITSCYWNIDKNSAGVGIGTAIDAAVYGLTTTEMKHAANFTDWVTDIDTAGGADLTWRIYEGYTYPLLKCFLTTTLEVTADDASKTYDGSAYTGTLSGTYTTGDGSAVDSSLVLGQDNLSYGSESDAGTYTLTGLYSTQQGYDIIYSSDSTLTINPKTITVGGLMAADKTYDGTTDATVSGTLGGLIDGDVVNLTGGSFSDKNAGTDKTVTVTSADLSGTDAGNYILATDYTTTADITAKTLTVTGLTAANKTYDGTTDAIVSGTLGGLTDGDVVNLTGGSFSDKNVGTDKTVTVTSAGLSGADAGNYIFETDYTTTAAITARVLTVSGITAEDKTYDRSVMAVLDTDGVTLDNTVAGDSVSLNVSGTSGTFGDKNAGTDKTVTVSGLTLTGADAGNYVLATTDYTTTADITAKALTVSGFSAADKVYDGTTAATVNGTITDVISGDDVSLSGSFNDKNAGSDKTVTATLTGTDAGNYTLSYTDTADIAAKALTVGGFNAADKVYDGTTAATVSGTIINAISGDDVTLTGSFSEKNAGSGKTVTAALTGTDAGNYTIAYSDTADITAKTLTVTELTAGNKEYDGTTAAALSYRSDAFAGDDLELTGSFDSKNVGTNKTVTVSLSGTDAGNYVLAATDTTTAADITVKALTVSGFSAADKIYDGTTAATVSGTITDAVGDDDVTLTGSFSDKNAGGGKTVTAALTGADAGNYTITYTDTADITAKTLTVSGFSAADKVYDGTTTAMVNGTINDAISGDDVTLTGTFSDKNAGSDKTVTAALTGTDAGNYTVSYTDTADITAKALTVSGFNAADKVYDGTTAATVDGTITNAVSGDDVILTGSFGDKNAGNGKTVTASLSGTDAGNYTIAYSDTADITRAALTVAVNDVTWMIGTSEPEYSVSYDGLVAGDTAASLDGTLTFTTSGTAASGAGQYTIAASGLSSVNYDIQYSDGKLTIVISAADPKYNGVLTAVLGNKEPVSFNEAGDFELRILDRGVNLNELELLTDLD
jgi:filamentous hemagglutinin family protein